MDPLDKRFDRMLTSIGGLGRWQWLVIFTFFLCIDGVNFYMYQMGYLELVPKEYFCLYEGSTSVREEVSCTPADFCGNSEVVSYRPNYELSDSYHNWVEKLDLECRSAADIGYLGSSTFLGWVITLAFVPRLSDIYGRKWIYVVGMIVQSTGFTVLMFTNQFWVAIAALFVNGMCCTIRAQIGILYMMEFMPLAKLPFVGSFYFLMETFTALLGVLYFASLSNDWFGYVAVGYSMQICGTILIIFIPESPKYLFKKGMILEASTVLRKIARVNGANQDLVSFDRVQACFQKPVKTDI